MSVSLIANPQKTINGILSNLNAGRSQLPFTFQREDFPVKDVLDVAPYIRVRLVDNPVSNVPQFPPGSPIYLDVAGLYVGIYTVFASVHNGSLTYIDIEEPYIGSGSGFVNTSTYANYKVTLTIRDDLNDAILLTPIIFKYSPDPTGLLFVDLSQVITELQESDEDNSLMFIVRYGAEWTDGSETVGTPAPIIQSLYAEKQIFQLGGSNLSEYLLKVYATGIVTEVDNWDGSTVRIDVNNANSFVVGSLVTVEAGSEIFTGEVTEVNQLIEGLATTIDNWNGATGRVYMVNPEIFTVGMTLRIETGIETINGDVTEITPGDHLRMTMDIVPAFYSGSAPIGTQGLAPSNLRMTITDPAGFVPSFFSGIGSIQITAGIAKLLTKFDNPKCWLGFNRTVSYVVDNDFTPTRSGGESDVRPIYQNYDINKVLIDQNSGSNIKNDASEVWPQGIFSGVLAVAPNTVYRGFYLRGGSTLLPFSETLLYKIEDVCAQPLYIEWTNSLGAREQHLFNINQSVNRTAEQGLLAESAIIEDQETVNRTKKRLPNLWTQSIIVTAENLSLNDLKALAEIKQSDYVTAWIDKNGNKQIYVIVSNDYSTEYETGNNSFEFSMQIEFPDNYDIFEVKEY